MQRQDQPKPIPQEAATAEPRIAHIQWADGATPSPELRAAIQELIDKAHAAIKEPAPASGALPPVLSVFDAAVEAELSKVSTVPYNSHDACKWFASNVRAALSTQASEARHEPVACQHEWVSARNKAVLSGEICRKCFRIRAEPTTDKPSEA